MNRKEPRIRLAAAFLAIAACLPILSGTANAESDIQQSDREVLIRLYHATGGPNWNISRDDWFEYFNRVHLDDSGRVIGIDLDHVNLTGSIPPELGKLSNLEKLYLHGNNLTGQIPPELAKLSKLKALFLNGNNLTGQIPPELAKLSKLKALLLNGNNLTGQIPPELGKLSNLERLYLQGNNLTGQIPSELGKLSRLGELGLFYNNLTGRIPPELGKLSNLERLFLQNNTLTGQIPPELGRLLKLRVLYLNTNKLTGYIPPELGKLSNLEGLSLDDNELTGSIPPELGDLSSLSLLSLSGNPDMAGIVPRELTKLDLSEFAIPYMICVPIEDGEIATWFRTIPIVSGANCPRGREALIVFYHATGGPNWKNNEGWLSDLPISEWYGVEAGFNHGVQFLSLPDNNLTGSIPPDLGKLSDLIILSINGNKLTGSIPRELGRLSKLRGFNLFQNELSGSIPAELGRLSNLEGLSLSQNELSGPIPSELGRLSNLIGLGLQENNLTGSIPHELGKLSNLRSLILSDNNLTGPIPSELGRLHNLEYLLLEGNNLGTDDNLTVATPAIPPELGDLFNLRQLRVSQNPYLWGLLPLELSKLDLVVLHFEDTRLCIPTTIYPELEEWFQAIPDKSGRTCQPVHFNPPHIDDLVAPINREVKVQLPVAGGFDGIQYYAIDPALPQGLVFNRATQVLSGTPTVPTPATTYTYTAGAINVGAIGTLTFTITVRPDAPEFGEASVADQVYGLGAAISGLTLPAATGGEAPLSYTISPVLPAGLEFVPGTRVLSGTPTAAMAATTYSYTATDADGNEATLTFTITVRPDAPEFGEASVADQVYGLGAAITGLTLPAATGGEAPLSYTISPVLPAGLEFDPGTRVLSGTPTAAMAATTYSYTATDADGNEATLTFTITVRPDAPEFGEASVADQVYGLGAAITGLTLPAATGGEAPLSYTISPVLPAGLEFDPGTRVLSGTPTAAMTATTYSYTATDADGNEATLTFTITVMSGPVDVPTDRDALVALYEAAGGANWSNSSGWLGEEELGSWYGVTADAGGRVTGLNLRNNGLAGSLPGALGGLSELRSLFLYSNGGLTGPVPAELGNLEGLDYFYAFGTGLCLPEALADWHAAIGSKGAIPACVGGEVLEFGEASVADQVYGLGAAITGLTLPAATGGEAPLSYTISPVLPAGLEFDPGTRVLSGTPTAAMAATTYSYTATDANGNEATLTFTIKVRPDAPEFGEASVADQVYGLGAAITGLTLPAATGGEAPLSYTISPVLPAGLEFDPGTRVLSGTPTAAMTATTYSYTATDADGNEATLTFTITVMSGPVDVPTDRDALVALYEAAGGANWSNSSGWLGEEELGSWYGVTADAGGRVTGLNLRNNGLAGSLPGALGGLSELRSLFLYSNGGLTGPVPAELGNLEGLDYFYAFGTGLCLPEALADWHAAIGSKGAIPACVGGEVLEFGEASVADQVYGLGAAITGLTLPAATGGEAPLSYTISPVLPAGLEFDPGTRVLSGTPTAAMAATTYSYTATDADGNEATLTFTITVRPDAPEFGEASVADQVYGLGAAITGLTLPAATGGEAPLSYTISPVLPAGLEFDPGTRVLSGTPTAAMTATTYSYTATDADGNEATLTFTITVMSGPVDVPTDRDALVALYEAAGGANWSNSSGWLGEEELGSWYGVTADAGGRVTGLNLRNNGLAGSLPGALGGLSELRSLFLYSNGGLTGPVPAELGNLEGLDYFYAFGTGLCLPEALADWHAAIGSKSAIPACVGGSSVVTASSGETLGATASTLPWIAVADARAEEGPDTALAFVVTLSPAGSGPVTVDYATEDGTARAGVDYAAVNATLTFASGETSKTVNVAILDDGHDEGEETLMLTLSNASGARMADGEATGTIVNTDPMPKLWLARFGRTVSEHVLDGVRERLTAPREAGTKWMVAGVGLGLPAGVAPEDTAYSREMQEETVTLSHWMETGPAYADHDLHVRARGLTGRELLTESAFALTDGTDGGGSVALWGRGALSIFDGSDSNVTLDGEVATALLGFDWAIGRWIAGLSLSHSVADGSYRMDGREGALHSSLTGLNPYFGYEVTNRLLVWGAVGWGQGNLKLKMPDGAGTVRTDIDMTMSAAGVRGDLVARREATGMALALEADALFARTGSAAVVWLEASEANVSRLRLGLEGSWGIAMHGGGSLTPTAELGIRHDGGDAETGLGVDIGGGLAFADSGGGLSGALNARTLLTHSADGFADWGVSGSLRFDPEPSSERGLTLTLMPSWGAASSGGADALLSRQTLAGLALDEIAGPGGRLDTEAAYGFGIMDGLFTGTPYTGLGLSGSGHELRLGWRLGLAHGEGPDFAFTFEGTRRERYNIETPVHELMVRATLRW